MRELEAIAFRWRAVDMSVWKATRLTQELRTLLEHFGKSMQVAQKPARAFQRLRRRDANSRKNVERRSCQLEAVGDAGANVVIVLAASPGINV